MDTGIYTIPADQYHASEGVSSHGLNALAISPLHYWAWFRNPERSAPKDSAATILGDAIHTAILEPDRFASEYVVEPSEADFPGLISTLEQHKEACRVNDLKVSGTKAELKLRLILAGFDPERFFENVYETITRGKRVVSRADMRVCRAISARVRRHPVAAGLFAAGKPEQSMFWKDPDTGVLCRGRADLLGPNFILDLKSARSAAPKAFQRSIISYKYHVQAAFYLDGMTALGRPMDDFFWAAWEKISPYASALYWALPEMIEAGRAEYKALLKVYAGCLEKDEWPGYSSMIEPVGLPEWYEPGKPIEQEEDDWLEAMSNAQS